MNTSSKPRWWTRGISTPNNLGFAIRSASRHHGHAAIDREPLPGDVLAGVRCEQQRRALQVLVVAEAPQRRVGGELVGADAVQRALRHPAREEAGADRVDVDAVLAPLAGQRLRE